MSTCEALTKFLKNADIHCITVEVTSLEEQDIKSKCKAWREAGYKVIRKRDGVAKFVRLSRKNERRN